MLYSLQEMRFPLSIIILLVCVISSCTINHPFRYNRDKLISVKEISADIDYIKNELESVHYDLNWGKRQNSIIRGLDSVRLNTHSSISLGTYLDKISKIINTVDDGHTYVLTEENNRTQNLNYSITILKSNIVCLRIPSFNDAVALRSLMIEFENTYLKYKPIAILVDFRGNIGGTIDNAEYFLSYFMQPGSILYYEHKIKINKGLLTKSEIKKLKKIDYKKEENYLVSRNKIISGRNNIVKSKIYVLVNENVLSAAMLCSYHLSGIGGKIIGKQPFGRLNSFGNVEIRKLPSSKLYCSIATARILLSQDSSIREYDKLIPDFPLEGKINLEDIAETIIK